MPKNEKSVVVVCSQLKFRWMIPQSTKYNHTPFGQKKTQQWWLGMCAVSGLGIKIVKIASGSVWVSRISVEGETCIETNLDDEQTPCGDT